MPVPESSFIEGGRSAVAVNSSRAFNATSLDSYPLPSPTSKSTKNDRTYIA